MSDITDVVATSAQNGGAATAVGSAVLGVANGIFGWLNSNSPGVLALVGIGGLFISWLGYRAKKRHMAQILENELRASARRADAGDRVLPQVVAGE